LVFNAASPADALCDKIAIGLFGCAFPAAGKIKAQKIGNGWKAFKADLDRFVRGVYC